MPYTPATRKTFILGAAPSGAYIRDTTLQEAAANDQIGYVNHNQQLLISEFRQADIAYKGNDRPYLNDSTSKYSCLSQGLIFNVPDPIPGTNNITTNNGGDTGSLVLRGLLYNAQIVARLRMITAIPNTGALVLAGLTSGAAVSSTVANTWEWISTTISFPTVINSGDLYELSLFFVADPVIGITPGYVGGYEVFESELQSANP